MAAKLFASAAVHIRQSGVISAAMRMAGTADRRPILPNSEHCLPGYSCTGLYAVNTSGIMPTQVLSFVSESLPSLAQADDHRAKAVLRAVRHLKC